MKKEGQGARQTETGKEKYSDGLGAERKDLEKTGTGSKTVRWRKEKIATGNRTEREFKMRGREQDKGRRRKK